MSREGLEEYRGESEIIFSGKEGESYRGNTKLSIWYEWETQKFVCKILKFLHSPSMSINIDWSLNLSEAYIAQTLHYALFYFHF